MREARLRCRFPRRGRQKPSAGIPAHSKTRLPCCVFSSCAADGNFSFRRGHRFAAKLHHSWGNRRRYHGGNFATAGVRPRNLPGRAHLSGVVGRNFGAPAETPPQSETTLRQPATPYGIAKVAADQFRRLHREKYQQFVSIGILYNHESPLRNPNYLSKRVAKAVADIKARRAKELDLADLTTLSARLVGRPRFRARIPSAPKRKRRASLFSPPENNTRSPIWWNALFARRA